MGETLAPTKLIANITKIFRTIFTYDNISMYNGKLIDKRPLLRQG